MEELHPRLGSLPIALVLGRRTPVAIERRARLLGLAGLECDGVGAGLLIPGCSSIHTLGMRFALDIWFLDLAMRPVGLRRGVRPGRLAFSRKASAVLERPSEGTR